MERTSFGCVSGGDVQEAEDDGRLRRGCRDHDADELRGAPAAGRKMSSNIYSEKKDYCYFTMA